MMPPIRSTPVALPFDFGMTTMTRDVLPQQVRVGDRIKWHGILFRVVGVTPTDLEIWIWATFDIHRARLQICIPRTEWVSIARDDWS